MGVLLDESELPSSTLLAAYHTYEYVAFFITLIFVTITMGVILTTTRGVSEYRWYLLNGLIWSLLFDAMGTLIGAVVLFPLPCYFGVNAAGSIGGNIQAVYFFLGVGAVIGKIGAIIFQLEYRFYQAQSSTSRYRYMCSYVSGSLVFFVRAGLLTFFMVLILVPFGVFFPDQDEQRRQLSSLDPLVAQIIHAHPALLCFGTGTDATKVLIVPFVVVGLLPIVGIFALSLIYMSIQQQELTMRTRRLQMMLFWSLFAQMAALFVLMVLPGLFYLGGPIFGMRSLPQVSVYCFFPFLTHTAADCILILYFIRPYRRTLLRHVCFFKTYQPAMESLTTQTQVFKVVASSYTP